MPVAIIVITLLVILCSILGGLLIKAKASNEHQFTLKELMNAQLEGEERGLLQATAILQESARFYGPSGQTQAIQEDLVKEIQVRQFMLGARKKVDVRIPILIKTE